ncbi:MAG: hypothetical protein Q8K92_10365 [Leadbetterella sp.]|nr:hypothetical protein [Leadbetterella sp.]
MKNIKFLFILAGITLVFACQKGETGDIGPVGEKGAKGAVGDKGEVGVSNSKGMIISAWIEVKAADWVERGTNAFSVQYTLPSLTSDIVNKGNVYFYMQPSGSNFVYPLPYSQANGSRFLGEFFNSSNIQRFNLNYLFSPTLGSSKLTTDNKFRLVILPAGARITEKVDWQNYDSVKKYLNLND